MKKLFFLTALSICYCSLYAQVTDSTLIDKTKLITEDSKTKIKDDKVKIKDEDGKLKIKDDTDLNADTDSKIKIKDDKAKIKDDEGKIKIKENDDMSDVGESKTKIKENKRKLKDADGKVKIKSEMSSDMNANTSNNSNTTTGINTNTTTVNIRTTTEVFPDKPATLPKVGGNVSAEVVTTLKNKYGASLYDIKQLKSSSGQIIYVVRLFDNGGMRSEYVGADGTVTVQ